MLHAAVVYCTLPCKGMQGHNTNSLQSQTA